MLGRWEKRLSHFLNEENMDCEQYKCFINVDFLAGIM